MSSNQPKRNQYDYQEKQAKANARESRRKAGSVLEAGAQQLEDYTAQMEKTVGGAASNIGQMGMYTFGGPGGRRRGEFRGDDEFGVSKPETDPYEVAADVSKEDIGKWEDLGSELSETEQELEDVARGISRLEATRRRRQERAEDDGSSSNRDVSVRESGTTPGGRDPRQAESTEVTDDGATRRTYGGSGGGSDSEYDGPTGLKDHERERLEELQGRKSELQEAVSDLESRREDISGQYEGEGSFGDAADRAGDLSEKWDKAVSEVGDTEIDVPEQLRYATGSNLLNLSKMQANMERDRAKIVSSALQAGDTALANAEMEMDSAEVFSQLADEQRRAEQRQKNLGFLSAGTQIAGGTLLTALAPATAGQTLAPGLSMLRGGVQQGVQTGMT